MFELPKSLQILQEACARESVSFTVVDTFSGFVVRLAKGGNSVLAGAAGIGVYPLNRAAPFAVARDKAFTHYVLCQDGFAVPDGEHFFLNPPERYVRPPGRERSDALAYGRKLSRGWELPLVVKPNSGKGARLVTFVQNEAELIVALEEIAPIDDLALVQSFVDAPEFRLFLVDGEIAFAYRKTRSEIVGDGESTVRELCKQLVSERPEQLAGLATSSYLRSQLRAHGLTQDSVLSKNVRLAVDFVSNISASGRFDGFLEPSDALREWARRLAKTASLRVTGVDIFSESRLAETRDIVVTDVNGSPNLGSLYDLGHRDLVFAVWSSILRKTFDEPWPEGF
jgi:glutathione synthase/RimK-type ligase-like ATP-grasp enzyme